MFKSSLKIISGSVILCCLVSQTFAGLFSPGDVKVSAYASPQQMRSESEKYESEIWKIPLDQHVIEQMLILDNDIAIVGLRNYNETLRQDQFRALDLKSGKSLWSYAINEDSVSARTVAVSANYTIIETVFPEKSELTCIQTRSGQQIWKKTLPSADKYRVHQIDKKYFMLASKKDNFVEYELLKIKTGKMLWLYNSELVGKSIPEVILYKKGLLITSKSLVSLDIKSGRVLWELPKISYNGMNAPPILNFKDLYIMGTDSALYRVNLEKGKQIWKHKVSDRYSITAIDPGKTKVYLRGMSRAGTGDKPIIIAVDKKRGSRKWQTLISDKQQLVSNFIEYRKKLFGASPTTLYALKQKSGKLVFSKKASKSQLSVYPVILRRIKDKIIFIGESNIAAYRASSGAYVYRKGMTGISPEADLSALEISIARLHEKKLTKHKRPASEQSTLFTQQYMTTQASSNAHYKNSTEAKWMGDYSKAGSEYMSSRIDGSFSKAYAGLSVYESAQNLSFSIYQGISDALDEDALARHKLIRNSILSSYPAMMSEKYVYRPTRSLNYSDDDAGTFMQITTVNLDNGKKTRTSMSVPFKEYGLWVHIDEKNKIVYQQSIGLDYNGDTPPVSYLIAKPLKLPE